MKKKNLGSDNSIKFLTYNCLVALAITSWAVLYDRPPDQSLVFD